MDSASDRLKLDQLSSRVGFVYQKFDRSFLGNSKVGQVFENIVRGLYECVLVPGDVAVDVGANYGLHTAPMARAVRPEGKVYAFEPVPVVCGALRKQIRDEGLDDVVQIFETALSNFRGRAEFVSVQQDYGYSGLREKPYPFEPRKKMIDVEVDTLDARVRPAARVAFIKLDIEGGEFHALQGGVGLLREQRPIVVLENAKQESARNYGYTKGEFFAFFRDLDYELRDIVGCPVLPEHWECIGPWYTVASPREQSGAVASILAVCVANQLFDLSW
jgi:FkbM family methyltransferase